MGTLQASFWTVGSVVKHQGPSGLLFGFRQKFSWRMLLGSEALNSLQVSRSEKEGNIQLAGLGEEVGSLPGTLS